MTWAEANNHCKTEGGKLVEIDSEEENTALVDEMTRKGYRDKTMHFWMGLTDAETEGVWRLASSSGKPYYLNWLQGEPNNLPNEDCACFRTRPNSWFDIDCDRSLHAICEFNPSTGNPSKQSQTDVAVTVSVLGLLLLLVIILLCIFKQLKARRSAEDVTDYDENPTYGIYFDPDPRMEVEDSNVYYSSDYEAGTGTSRTTDNNPYYE